MTGTPRPGVAVCGFGRCGSSAMMLALHQGGYEAFEDETRPLRDLFELGTENVAALLRRPPEGRPFKVLDHILTNPVHARRNLVLVLMRRRDTMAQARSMVEFLRDRGQAIGGTEDNMARLARGFEDDWPKLHARALEIVGGTRRAAWAPTFVYEDLRANPWPHMVRLAQILPGLDPEAAAKAVLPPEEG